MNSNKKYYYHCSPVKNRVSIKKEGLTSRYSSKDKDRIYVWDDLEKAKKKTSIQIEDNELDVWRIAEEGVLIYKIEGTFPNLSDMFRDAPDMYELYEGCLSIINKETPRKFVEISPEWIKLICTISPED